MKAARLAFLAFLALAVPLAAENPARDWQFSTPIPGKNRPGRAFLWIPPNASEVRGVIFGQQVILESNMLEDPRIRAAAAAENLAILLFSPHVIGYTIDDATWATLQGALTELAAISGYTELAHAPLLPVGHSGGAIWAWHIAYRAPERTLAVLTLKAAAINPPAYAPNSSVDGIPTLSVTGQYETWGAPKPGELQRSAEHHWRWLRGDVLAMRGKNQVPLQSILVEPGVTHFGWDNHLADYAARFIRAAARARLPETPPPADQPPRLRTVAESSGWLTDVMFFSPNRFEPAPAAAFQGDPRLAMWHLDGDLARANDRFGHERKGKKLQLVTFVDQGQPLPSAWIQGVKYAPLDDGRSLRLQAEFVKTTPPELAFPARDLGHADGPIQFRLIGGWTGGGEQTGPDTFRPRMERLGYVRGYGSLMVMAFHPGDASYAYCEQPASISFPATLNEGTPQTIDFPAIPDVAPGAPPIRLAATADSRLPVDYLVLEGPAEIEGETLRFTPIPPRTKFPVKITVVASQWGRALPPLYRSAPAAERSFWIQKAAPQK